MEKLPLTIAVALVWCGVASHAQIADPPESHVRIISRGPHHNICEWSFPETNEVGEVTWKTSRFTQLETGLNRWQPPANPSDSGQWAPASDEFTLTPDGAVATNGQHHVFVSGQLNQDGAVQIELPSGEIIATRIYGLAYYSPSTGQSTLIAELKDCQGTLLPNKHQIVFSDAFTDIGGSVRLSYTRAGFESDVVLDTQLPSPSDWNLPDDSVVEVLTEFTQMPEPDTETEILADGSADQAIAWNEMRMAHGKAFFVGKEEAGVPVHKQLLHLDGRRFLSEHVRYRDLEPKLQGLPPPPPEEGALQPMRHKVTRGRALELRRAQNKTSTPIKLAMATEGLQGYVIDYQILLSQNNVTLCGGTTYYVTGPVTLGQNTVVENCIVKFTNNASIAFNGPVQFLSSPYAPALFLGKDDNSAGDLIPGSTGRPNTNWYASVALDFNTGTNVLTMQNIRVANAQTAVRFWATSGHVISHAQFCNCAYGITATASTYALRNALFWNVQTNFSGSGSTVLGEHLTIDGANQMNYGQGVFLTNSLLVAVTNYGGYTNVSGFTASDPGTVFQNSRSGLHYLANNSPYRDVGTTVINSNLLVAFRNMTTYPPIWLTNSYSTPLVLSRSVLRDTDTPDIGYHYDAVDFIGAPSLGSTMVLTNGVAVALTGNGFTSGSAVYSSGTATALNRIARYSYVQECWTNYNGALFLAVGGGTYRFRFTDFTIPSAIAPISSVTNAWCNEISFRDCQFHGCNIDLGQVARYYGVGGFTNNILDRSAIYVSISPYPVDYPYNPGFVFLFNNLFRNTPVTLTNNTSEVFQNNVFDGIPPCAINYGTNTFGYNAFAVGTSNSLGGANNKTNVTTDYKVGPLGRYYYPSNGAGLYTLKDAGSCNSTNFGLYHYTTCINLVKETNSIDDPGFHYVATDVNGNPIDSDGDLIPDYLEDSNGDGVYNSATDLSNWQLGASDTDGDGVNDYIEWLQGRNPRGTGTIQDSGGLINMRIYTPLH